MDEPSARAAAAFGLATDGCTSLCTDGPVWRLRAPGGDVVLKRTGHPRSSGDAISAWLTALAAHGIDVVAPDPRFGPNPRKLEGTWPGEWVVYPFVPGPGYTGALPQVEAAGRLLGRLHAAGGGLGQGMMEEARLPLRSDAWLADAAGHVTRVLAEVAPALVAAWERQVDPLLARHSAARVRLADVELPLAACCWDYKASNLVFAAPDRPVLVDPDHAGRIPRLYDLACALVLFHVDHPGSPGRLFSATEWQTFLAGYSSVVELTAAERHAWPDVLLAAWADQGVWLLGNWPDGWSNARERAYLGELTRPNLAAFVLW